FRFWLWLTTAQNTKEWTAIHRKHHAKCETGDDPHSPVVLGIRKVLLEGAELYAEAATPETLERYGQRTPEDWIERNLYSRYKMAGIALMAAINLLLFGVNGIWIWAVQMMWIRSEERRVGKDSRTRATPKPSKAKSTSAAPTAAR